MKSHKPKFPVSLEDLRWMITDAVGIKVQIQPVESRRLMLHIIDDQEQGKPCVLVFYKTQPNEPAWRIKPLSSRRIREFLLSGVYLTIVHRSHLTILKPNRILKLVSYHPDYADIEIEAHTHGQSLDRILPELDRLVVASPRMLDFWIPLIAAFFSWREFRQEDFWAARWFVRHVVENLEPCMLGLLEEERRQNSETLWHSRQLSYEQLGRQMLEALLRHLDGRDDKVGSLAGSPSEAIWGLTLLCNIVIHGSARELAAHIAKNPGPPDAVAERKAKLAYFYAIWSGKRPPYRKLLQEKVLPNWDIAVQMMHMDYLVNVDRILNLGSLVNSVPDIIVQAGGIAGAPVVDQVDLVYARDVAKKLLGEAEVNRRYTPKGLYYLPMPEAVPVQGVEGLYLWVAKDRVVVRPAPYRDGFVWFPRENGLANSWAPLALYERDAVVWEALMAAIWRDLLVGGIAVEHPDPVADRTARRSRRRLENRQNIAGAQSSGRSGLRLPTSSGVDRSSPARSLALARCTWSSEAEIQRIRRLYKVRGHPRRLKPGQNPSQFACRNAQEYGFYVPNGYTFVRPHIVGANKEAERDVETPIQALGLSSLMLMRSANG